LAIFCRVTAITRSCTLNSTAVFWPESAAKKLAAGPKRDAGTAFQDNGEALREQWVRIHARSYGGASRRNSLQAWHYPCRPSIPCCSWALQPLSS
jgi:hypothetical protein